MLVLSRKRNESIVVEVGGELVNIVVVDLGGGQAKIGLDAAKHVAIHRREVYDKIEREKERERRLQGDIDGNASTVRQPASDDASGEQEGRKAG
jgi:carbon storage regulator